MVSNPDDENLETLIVAQLVGDTARGAVRWVEGDTEDDRPDDAAELSGVE